MPNPISSLFAILLAVFAMFYFPMYQNYKKHEDLAYINTQQTVTAFVDNVRMKGFITPKMYEDFALQLHAGHEVLFDIEMEHQQKRYVPVYTDPANPNSFTDNYIVDYDSYYWEQIKSVLYDESVPYDKRMYKLQKDDYFDVVVENRTKFKSTMLLNTLTGGIAGENNVIYYPYGGKVLNQDWIDY